MGFIGPISAINWEKESYPGYGDLVFFPAFAIFFPAARFFLDSFVFEKCARRCILGKGKNKLIVGAEDRKKLDKFKESAWKLVYFLSAELLALFVSYNEPWFTDTRYFWVGPGEQAWPDQMTKLKLKMLYMFGGGFYLYSIFALLFWETRRKDFVISMVHHVSTLTLIALSYIFRFTRVGSVVLAIHDATDVFLEVAKMSRYSGYQGFANFAFALFVIMWVLLRLMYYSFSVLRSTSYEAILIFDVEEHKFIGSLFYYIFNTLLFCLLALNIYWWILMCRMIIRQIKASGELGDDIRSDSEGEDEHTD